MKLEGLGFRLEAWQPGNDYLGFHAARDGEYAKTIYEVLRENWPNPTSDFIDEW